MLIDEIRRMLIEFINEINKDNWFGKERELINRFVFTKLLSNIGCHKDFYSPAQIGIEVRVKQINGKKKEVCKDLIIWEYPNQNVFCENNIPIIIMEWKFNNKKPSKYDIKWLKEYTKINKKTTGLALNVDKKDKFILSCVLIKNGEIVNNNFV